MFKFVNVVTFNLHLELIQYINEMRCDSPSFCTTQTGLNPTFLSFDISHYWQPIPTDQEERQWAIKEFKSQRKDVLVATDIASKGLDFPNIQHVINYDMPADIENYGIILYYITAYVLLYMI